ncbi:MAG: peptidoglycan-binding protein [Candidatus Competibacterales bacterium]|nr:peptidoglycan-binding protein [Candidatus Competibacterales bacterium]
MLLLLTLTPLAGAAELHNAARSGDTNRVQSLLGAGAEVNARDDYGFTPLLLADLNGHDDTVRVLRRRGGSAGLRGLVKRLQYLLTYLGHATGGTDGLLGPETRDAIRAFQREAGLPVTGRVREDWVAALHRRALVRIQRRLSALGHYTGPVDGLFGPGTRNAIRAFQREQKLSVDGRLAGDWLTRLTPVPAEDAALRELQVRLTVLGHDTDGVDGLLGPGTRNAIRAFQRRHGLRVDGQPSASLRQRVDQELVRQVQQQLQAQGFDPGPVDGVAGAGTETAIRAFQRQQKLAVDGRADTALLERLQTPRNTLPRDARAADPDPEALVAAVQRQLNRLGYGAGPVDGVLGPATTAAIRSFERQAGLTVSGEPSTRLLARLETRPTPATRSRRTRDRIEGTLRLQYADSGELLGCSISGHQIERSWCRSFEHHGETDDCWVRLREDASVLALKCR